MARSAKPVIGVMADRKTGSAQPLHAVQEKYLEAVGAGAGAIALILPAQIAQPGAAFADPGDVEAVLDLLDGLCLTGSVSNIEPRQYGAALADAASPADPARDAAALALARGAVARGLPLLGLCRGFQEINVALGGSLHQAVHEVPGLHDHREDRAAPLATQYGPAHEVRFAPGGMLHLFTGQERAMVNSLHGQGIERLAEGLVRDAEAPDGLIEAFRSEGEGFVLGVQWHPEWAFRDNAVSLAIFRAFGAAARAWQRMRAAHPSPSAAVMDA